MTLERAGIVKLPSASLALCLAAVSAAYASEPAGDASLSGALPSLAADRADPAIAPQSPGESVDFASWSDWTGGETYTRLSRIDVLFSFGMMETKGGAMTHHWDSGVGLSLDAGYAFAPFLAAFFNLHFGQLAGEEEYSEYMGTPGYFRPADFTAVSFGLELRLRLPFNLIGPQLFRFSKAREGLGLVPAFKFGAGVSRTSKTTLAWDFGGTTEYPTIFEQDMKPYFKFGFDIEIRWKHFGIALSYEAFNVGQPETGAGAPLIGISGEDLKHQFVSLTMGLYF